MDRFDLGAHTRRISSTSPAAQKWFNLGLNWSYGFNQEEGVKCFRKALESDPDCLMAHWGIAYACGPFYNLPWRDLGAKEAAAVTALAFTHIGLARERFDRATRVEWRLVEALSRRYQKPHAVPPEEFDKWDDDYAAEMRRVHYEFPNDHDVMALFAEALITRTPRRLWDVRTGLPANDSDVVEAVARDRAAPIALSDATGRPHHPAIVHMHIHALEMSNHPEDAMRSADVLGTFCPDAGHMNHMPGHIYVLCGDYEKAVRASEKAITADNVYADYAGSFNFYVTARCHDLHLMIFTCMLLGRYKGALEAANTIRRILPREILAVRDRPKLAYTTEAYYSMKMHVLVRFGQWQAIIDQPMPDDPDLYLISTAMQHYARGVAYATLKNIAAAEEEEGPVLRKVLDVSRRIADSSATMLMRHLGVGEKMLEGELEYHKGNYAAAFAALRESVRRDDSLSYTEPWAWMHPPRHALAALLAEQGHYAQAEEVYRDDLGLSGRIQRCTQHPDNVWALHGIVECLRQRGETEEHARLSRKLDDALAKADVPITSSCMCRATVYAPINSGRDCCA